MLRQHGLPKTFSWKRVASISIFLLGTLTGCDGPSLFQPKSTATPNAPGKAIATPSHARGTKKLTPRNQLPDFNTLFRFSGFQFATDGSGLVSKSVPVSPVIGPQENLLFGDAPYRQRLERLYALIKNPDPAAEPTLIRIVITMEDPLSAHALLALGALHTPGAFACIHHALDDSRGIIREHALALLLQANASDDLPQICRDRFINDPSALMRALAALGLGAHYVTQAIPELRAAMNKDMASVRLASAWSLSRLGDDSGRQFLESLVLQNDPNLSPQAIGMLFSLGDTRSARVLLYGFDSTHTAVWEAVFSGFVQTPETFWKGHTLFKELSKSPTDAEWRTAGRQALAVIASGKTTALGEGVSETPGRNVWGGLLWLSEHGTREEQLVLIQVLSGWNDPRSYEPLLRVLNVPREDTRNAARTALELKATQHDWKDTPASSLPNPWWRWWVAKSSIFEHTRGQEHTVLVRTPDGLLHYPVAGLLMSPGVRVISVRIRRDNEPASMIFQIGDDRITLLESMH